MKNPKDPKNPKNFEIHLELGGNKNVLTPPPMGEKFTKTQNFWVFGFLGSKTTFPACKDARSAAGQGRKGKGEQSERAKNGKIVPQNFRQRKSFLSDAVIRNYLL